MDIEEIQKRLNNIRLVMTEKALIKPLVKFNMESDRNLSIWAGWSNSERSVIWDKTQDFKGETLEEKFDNGMQWARDLPSPKQAKRDQFLRSLADTIELGRANGIDLDFINPLTEAMKKLSENALEDHSNG